MFSHAEQASKTLEYMYSNTYTSKDTTSKPAIDRNSTTCDFEGHRAIVRFLDSGTLIPV